VRAIRARRGSSASAATARHIRGARKLLLSSLDAEASARAAAAATGARRALLNRKMKLFGP
jgi:hypothetical protein